MQVLVHVDFVNETPIGNAMARQHKDVYKNITNDSGMIWNICSENQETLEARGIYLLHDRASA